MAIAFLGWRPPNLHGAYSADVARALSRPTPPLETITDGHLKNVPPPVQRYLRLAGAVGQAAVTNFRVRLHGRIRSAADSRWLPLGAEQYNFVRERQRYFYLTSSMFGVPVQGYHRYADASASMDIKAAGLIPVARASGAEMFQSETVTLLNDMCMFAPTALIDPACVWDELDPRTVRLSFTNAGVMVRADLRFNDAGELIDFVSDDRYQLSPDGMRATRRRWSTPVSSYRAFGERHLIGSGEGRWHTADGSFAYIELEVDDVAYNVGRH